MAYVRKDKVFALAFEEPNQFAGLHIKTKSLKVKEFAEFALRLGTITERVGGATIEAQLAALPHLINGLEEMKEMFADALLEWDMEEEDGAPTPTTLEGVQRLEDTEFYKLIGEWLTALGGVDEELGKDLGSGAKFPELSDLMEPLSPSQAS